MFADADNLTITVVFIKFIGCMGFCHIKNPWTDSLEKALTNTFLSGGLFKINMMKKNRRRFFFYGLNVCLSGQR